MSHIAHFKPDVHKSSPVKLSLINRSEISTRHGASARVLLHNEQEVLQVQDQRGQIIFEYHPEIGKAVLTMPTGDLALNAPQGNIQLLSGKSIVCGSVGPTVFESAHSLSMNVKSKNAQTSSLHIGQDSLSACSEKLNVNAQHTEAHFSHINIYAKVINGTVERAKWIYHKLENVIERLIERTRDTYRQTEDLHQLKARRARILVGEDYTLKSENMDIRADKTVKVDGKQIHLG